MSESPYLRTRWQAAAETTIGGWCVQPEGEKPTHEGGVEIACFVREEDARHIAEVHNLWLEVQNTDVLGRESVPADNLTTSSSNALAEALAYSYWRVQPRGPEEWADTLIESGAVIDVSTLADDEELVKDVARRLFKFTPDYAEFAEVKRYLHALAAALNERGEQA